MSHVSLGVSFPKSGGKQGSLVANYYLEGGGSKSKTVSIDLHGIDIAYETVDLWAEDTAKEHGVEYRKISLEHITKKLEDFKTGVLKHGQRDSVKTEPNQTLFNNKSLYKKEITKAFNHLGATRIREVIQDGLAYLNEIEKEKEKLEKNTNKAKLAVAKGMYNTFVDTGVDTSKFCNNDEIINEFNRLREQLPLE